MYTCMYACECVHMCMYIYMPLNLAIRGDKVKSTPHKI